ncbi:MAG: sensor histidine kinase [Phycisphaerales bacterium]
MLLAARHAPIAETKRDSPYTDAHMPTSGASSASVLHSVSPFRVFVLILATVFTVEFVIMVVIAKLTDDTPASLWISLIDSSLLTAFLCPVVWMLTVRPLRALVAERGELLDRAYSIQEDERARIARDLHDELGQAQTVLLLGLRAISRAETLHDARERAAWLLEPAASAMDSTRRLSRGLSLAILTDFGLSTAIPRLCEDIAKATEIAIACTVEITGRRYPTPVEIACYRVVQEAITNAAKHSGASDIHVALEQVGDRLRVRIRDEGKGLPHGSDALNVSAGKGLGLSSMRERVVLLGGDFRMTSNPGRGTTVEASFPIGVHNP